MALDLRDCTFTGSALPETFVRYQLEEHLLKRKLLPRGVGTEGKQLQQQWEIYRRKLRALGEQGGELRVMHQVLEPLKSLLGYATMERQSTVMTREGAEEGGWLLTPIGDSVAGGGSIRAWTVGLGIDLDAPNRRGRAFRFSPSQVAHRVLLASNERVGLLTDGEELRLLLCDPSRLDSHVSIRLDASGGWRGTPQVPDSFRLLMALASPAGIAALPGLIDEARLAQTAVTRKLRQQARSAVEGFIQAVLDHPENHDALKARTDRDALARDLWHEGLILVYRLLFVLKLESSSDPARAFSFSSQSLWRNTYSPNTALGPIVRRVLDIGIDSGGLLEHGLRALFRLFEHGLTSTELKVSALGGKLFGSGTAQTLEPLRWGERAVALLLDALLWTPPDGKNARERIHYGGLDVEELGRVYEALLELEPGVTHEPMTRLRRAKLEVVVPTAKAASYAAAAAPEGADDTDDDDADDEDEEASGKSSKKSTGTTIQRMEDIPAGRFFLRVGLGRKASGAYYTPRPFVRFLVQETLRPQLEARTSHEEPHPERLLTLKVLDPAMGSGGFLVEACRYLGEALYEACRLCDERAAEAEARAEAPETSAEERLLHLARARTLRERVRALPDPDDELLQYLPSRVIEGGESGFSQRRAEAICRRLVAVHCLYGVDKNPLAVELARVSLWLESYAEGLPLTFLDHRLVVGDSLTGPRYRHLLTRPSNGEPVEGLFLQQLQERQAQVYARACQQVEALEASVGVSLSDLLLKEEAYARLQEVLHPLRVLAAVWSGAVMANAPGGDSAYAEVLTAVLEGRSVDALLRTSTRLQTLEALGREGVAWDLTFPEIFLRAGGGGFHAVLGNPPWDALQPLAKEFFAAYDLGVLDAPTRKERSAVEKRLSQDPIVKQAYEGYVEGFDQTKRLFERLYTHINRQAGGQPSGAVTDIWQAFAERGLELLTLEGRVGQIYPSAFHANQSATGIRQLYLEHARFQCCFSFENRQKLFEIDSRFKFAAIVAQQSETPTEQFECAFYLHELGWLFSETAGMNYTLEFVKRTGGEYYSLLELTTPEDAVASQSLYRKADFFGTAAARVNILLGRELHMTDDAFRFTNAQRIHPLSEDPRNPSVAADLLARGYLPLHEGKTFHQYDDRWAAPPRYLVALSALEDKPAWRRAAQYYRLAFRDIASSTNERTGIFCLLPPGVVCGNTAPCERQPEKRLTASALSLLAISNTLSFDWPIRQKAAAHVNLFILNGCPMPRVEEGGVLERFLAHGALRLSCNHAGYAALWREQLGNHWKETGAPFTWPVLEGEEARQRVRADLDAVVAHAYGLTREQFGHILSTFNHKSHPSAPERCLAAFDALDARGLEAFVRARDPYHDVPLPRTLPEPVLNLMAPSVPSSAGASASPSEAPPPAMNEHGQVLLLGGLRPRRSRGK